MGTGEAIFLVLAAAAAPSIASELGARAGIVRVAGDPDKSVHTPAWDAAWSKATGPGPFGLLRVKARNLTELLIEQRDALLASHGQLASDKVPTLSTSEMRTWVGWWLAVWSTGDDASGSGHDVDDDADNAKTIESNLAGYDALGVDVTAGFAEQTVDAIANLATAMDQFWLTDRDTSRSIGGGLSAAGDAITNSITSLPGDVAGVAAGAIGNALGAIAFSTPVLLAGLAYVFWRFS